MGRMADVKTEGNVVWDRKISFSFIVFLAPYSVAFFFFWSDRLCSLITRIKRGPIWKRLFLSRRCSPGFFAIDLG